MKLPRGSVTTNLIAIHRWQTNVASCSLHLATVNQCAQKIYTSPSQLQDATLVCRWRPAMKSVVKEEDCFVVCVTLSHCVTFDLDPM
jgi:hypothetical protein